MRSSDASKVNIPTSPSNVMVTGEAHNLSLRVRIPSRLPKGCQLALKLNRTPIVEVGVVQDDDTSLRVGDS